MKNDEDVRGSPLSRQSPSPPRGASSPPPSPLRPSVLNLSYGMEKKEEQEEASRTDRRGDSDSDNMSDTSVECERRGEIKARTDLQVPAFSYIIFVACFYNSFS